MVPLRVNEAVGGTGDFCGSTFLDQAFDRYIRRVLGDSTIDGLKPRPRSQMKKSFDKAKEEFANADVDYEICVPGLKDDPKLEISEGFYTMPGEDLKGIFDPIVDRIIELVRRQVGELQKAGKPIAVRTHFLACEYRRYLT